MNAGNGTTFKVSRGFFRVLPFLALGGIVFALNSTNEWNYFAKGYVTLLELQAAIVVLYFLTTRIGRSKNRLLK
jgi:hypothetical protein